MAVRKSDLDARMLERLNKQYETNYPADTKIIRQKPSRSWRGSGRWAWYIEGGKDMPLGSMQSVRELLSCKRWVLKDFEIIGYKE